MVVDRNRKALPVEIPFQVVSGEEREATEVGRFQSAWVSGVVLLLSLGLFSS
jgi:hypothetical protein